MKWVEYLASKKSDIRASGESLYDQSQNCVPRVAMAELRTRTKIERLPFEILKHRLRRRTLASRKRSPVIGNARCVSKQILESDRHPRLTATADVQTDWIPHT